LVLICIIVIGLFGKFAVVDKLIESKETEEQYRQTAILIEELQLENSEYDKIKGEYSHYFKSNLNTEEKAEQDRMQILDAIENGVLAKAGIYSMNIQGNTAILTIDRVRLSTVSDIVAELKADQRILFVSVSNATTGENSRDFVTTSMIINFKEVGGE
ncbi:MAG: hypothetical protein PHX63_08125, partial [Eubacteriales bacterium]|nr:hypothetical protein [Eubacteriales bacterium]